jgi:hypothetical protein
MLTVFGRDLPWTIAGDVSGAAQDDGTFALTGGELSVTQPSGADLGLLPNIVVVSGSYNPSTQSVTYEATQGLFSPTIAYDGVAHTASVTDGPLGSSPALATTCDITQDKIAK